MEAENILKDIEKESKEISKWGDKKISEKDYLIAIIIVSAIAISFFVYVNFIPKYTPKISSEFIEIGGCDNCFDVKSLADGIIKTNENIEADRKTLDYNSKEAKDLIEKYNIKRIPALVITSKKIDKIDLIDKQTFSIGKNYAIFDKSVPYIELDSGKIRGLVNFKEIYTECKDCMPLSTIKGQFEKLGIKINNYEAVPDSTERGKSLIKDNDLTFLPSLLISKDIEEYWWVFEQIKSSLVKKQEYYVFKNPVPPYKELITGKIKGIVDMTYITNKSCLDCFNVSQLKGSFQSLGVFINNEKYIDIGSSEGKNLLSEYNITAIPTVILSKGIQDYDSIKELLKQIGTFEDDKVFIFRRVDSLKVKYQELK